MHRGALIIASVPQSVAVEAGLIAEADASVIGISTATSTSSALVTVVSRLRRSDGVEVRRRLVLLGGQF